MTVLSISTDRRIEMKDITSLVSREVEGSGLKEGICLVYVPHTTAAVTINEGADPSVRNDILDFLARLVPASGNYRHSEGNSDSHIKATLVGSSVSIPIEKGRLALGTWQSIFFCEFDGPRSRRVIVSIR
jgi:secondary thiamine-phosphate synthase enzyme